MGSANRGDLVLVTPTDGIVMTLYLLVCAFIPIVSWRL
jgi:hypothetical protein